MTLRPDRHGRLMSSLSQFSSVFIPPSSGDWLIGLTGIDHALLFIDGKLVVDYSKDLKPGKLFFEFCQEEKTTFVKGLQAGNSYDVEVRCWNTGKLDALPVRLPAGFQIGAVPVLDPEQGIKDAVALSASCDATIVVIGLGKDYETEGSDRSTMKLVSPICWQLRMRSRVSKLICADDSLPGNSDKLIEAVLAKTPDAIIVIQSGMPTTMTWEDRASTVVQVSRDRPTARLESAKSLIFASSHVRAGLLRWYRRRTWHRRHPFRSSQPFGQAANVIPVSLFSLQCGESTRYHDQH